MARPITTLLSSKDASGLRRWRMALRPKRTHSASMAKVTATSSDRANSQGS
ncbi:hypothetical protein D3C72_1531450 [compost metagenome]